MTKINQFYRSMIFALSFIAIESNAVLPPPEEFACCVKGNSVVLRIGGCLSEESESPVLSPQKENDWYVCKVKKQTSCCCILGTLPIVAAIPMLKRDCESASSAVLASCEQSEPEDSSCAPREGTKPYVSCGDLNGTDGRSLSSDVQVTGYGSDGISECSPRLPDISERQLSSPRKSLQKE